MIRAGISKGFLRFCSTGGAFFNLEYKDILFDAEYWRGSVEGTKAYVKTLFTIRENVSCNLKHFRSSQLCKTNTSLGSRSQSQQPEEDALLPQPSNSIPGEELNDNEDESRSLGGSAMPLDEEIDDTFDGALEAAFKLVNDAYHKEVSHYKSQIEERDDEIKLWSEGIKATTKEIAEHEDTIRSNEQTIERQRNTISDLKDKIRSIESLPLSAGDSAIPDNASQNTSLEAQNKKLQKDLDASLTANKGQAQKIASLLIEQPGHKQADVIKLMYENGEKDDKIKTLEEQLLAFQTQNGNLQQQNRLSPALLTIDAFELHGLHFDDSFVKIPEQYARASMYKERNGVKFTAESNMRWQKTRMLQDGIVIAGVPQDRVQTINGAAYACYEENGKQKRLRLPDEKSLVNILIIMVIF